MKIEYNNMPLEEFCGKYNMNYDMVIQEIQRLKDTGIYLGYTDNMFAEIVIERIIKAKYRIDGISLYKYCKDNGIDYKVIVQKLLKATQHQRYKDLDMESIIKKILKNEYINTSIIYVYKNQPLVTYCKKMNINYNTMKTRIRKLKNIEKYKNYTNDQLVEIAIEQGRAPSR